MPYRNKHPCGIPTCPNLTYGKYCEEHQKQANRDYDRYHRSPESYNRYHSKQWRELRRIKLHSQPLCEMCLQEGRYTPATLVHHIIPLSEGGSNTLENCQSVCEHHHSRLHALRGDRWHNKNHQYGTGSHNAGEMEK